MHRCAWARDRGEARWLPHAVRDKVDGAVFEPYRSGHIPVLRFTDTPIFTGQFYGFSVAFTPFR